MKVFIIASLVMSQALDTQRTKEYLDLCVANSLSVDLADSFAAVLEVLQRRYEVPALFCIREQRWNANTPSCYYYFNGTAMFEADFLV